MYVITGATGHTGRIITEKLLSEGKRVRIISRSEEKAKDLVKKGAELVIGNQLSSASLVHAFKDATAIYAMIATQTNLPSVQSKLVKYRHQSRLTVRGVEKQDSSRK